MCCRCKFQRQKNACFLYLLLFLTPALHASLRDPLLNQAIQFKNIWWHPFKKKYGNKWSSCSEYTTDSIKYFVYLSWREYVLCTGGMILLSVHTCQQNKLWTVQFIIFFVCTFTWALFYFVNKNEPGYSSHWCKVRGLFLTPIYRRFCEP